jgi:DNA-binding CsgD family transcriptional regulator
VDTATDPYVSTGLLNIYSYSLFVAGRYADALSAADKEVAIAAEFELPFVTPHAQLNRACALTALRAFGEARRALRVVERRPQAGADPYLASQHTTQSAAIAIGQGDLRRATDHLASGIHARESNASKGIRDALHALVLAALDRGEEADDKARSALLQSQSVETHALLTAGSAIRAAARRDSETCIRAYEEIAESGAFFALSLAWRARYELAALLLSSPEHRESVLQLLLNSNDTAIAKRSGISLPRAGHRRLGLSAREQEVCDLIAQGRTNQEIATMLFISLSTTKVHVKHILEKLGVRTRVEAARIWEDRSS